MLQEHKYSITWYAAEPVPKMKSLGKLCLLNLACVPSQARAATRSTAERSRFAAIIPVTALARYYGNVRLAPSYRRTGLELDSCSTPSPGSYALYHL